MLLHVLALAGCQPEAGDLLVPQERILEAAPWVELEAPAAFDPLAGPLAFTVRTNPHADVGIEVAGATFDEKADADGVLALTWEDWTSAGAHTLVARVGDAEASATVVAVRPGFLAARLEDDDGVSALRVPLVFPADSVLQSESDPVATLEAIDDGEVPLDFPAVDLASALARRPEAAEPAAFVYDSRPLLVLDVASASPALGGTGLDVVEVEVAAAGWTVLSGSPLGTDPVVLQLDAPLGDTVGISLLDVEVVASVAGEPVSSQRVPLTIFRLLDESGFQHPEAIYEPWAPVVAQALGAIDGTTADHAAVVDALVDWVYNDLGLVYDTVAGASAYSTYVQFQWDRPHFFLSDFLVRRFGDVVNCSDAGNILGAYANMVGARLDHVIVDPPFDLNEIKAIGQPEYTSCPFGAFGCGFSYHAVTTAPGTNLVWDATLALDGDADPGAGPHTELLVQGIDGGDYLDRLVRSGNPGYGDIAQETIE